ncbi:unnamed protein product [Schistocephalus solidus]|uniref:CULLIN_2 domain-containing protein n=1 Tax=Schistocephalus solidus TaxID=70667 RepID=A0A183TH37_SCHSO|nr:unnamed protein product [Schistocephalus solidus]
MDIFKYMEDKDVFQKFYSNMLARRLVNGLSISDDTEVSMISRLKGACGFEYTTKLQRMFQDVGSSRDLNIKFSEYLSENPTSQGLLKGGKSDCVRVLLGYMGCQVTSSTPKKLAYSKFRVIDDLG